MAPRAVILSKDNLAIARYLALVLISTRCRPLVLLSGERFVAMSIDSDAMLTP